MERSDGSFWASLSILQHNAQEWGAGSDHRDRINRLERRRVQELVIWDVGRAAGSVAPDRVADTGNNQGAEDTEEGRRPFALAMKIQANDGPAVAGGEPRDEGVSQRASSGKDGQKSRKGDAEGTRSEQERRQRNRWGKDCREKDSEDRMALHPLSNASASFLGNPTAQSCFAPLFPEMPTGVSADQTSEDGATCEEPRISPVNDEEQ